MCLWFWKGLVFLGGKGMFLFFWGKESENESVLVDFGVVLFKMRLLKVRMCVIWMCV